MMVIQQHLYLALHYTPCTRRYFRRRTLEVAVLPSFRRDITLPDPVREFRRCCFIQPLPLLHQRWVAVARRHAPCP